MQSEITLKFEGLVVSVFGISMGEDCLLLLVRILICLYQPAGFVVFRLRTLVL